eukprot:CAMPEP_0202882506 /NCGR_PEP_ID=MMETSP1391-20130828/38090_1 /ASSEMBLY_ACC=CAM_ASM_000867 /TAXON_ID=1034604 /ORGANISM="Chlamydomonas leiostraca, Strain SAG 11-49" /LENGTH=236 /DNA_ID=CAMNT_0049565373 /DNA_START=91 /DNA_END=801 /DNA_ORIENTATION=-
MTILYPRGQHFFCAIGKGQPPTFPLEGQRTQQYKLVYVDPRELQHTLVAMLLDAFMRGEQSVLRFDVLPGVLSANTTRDAPGQQQPLPAAPAAQAQQQLCAVLRYEFTRIKVTKPASGRWDTMATLEATVIEYGPNGAVVGDPVNVVLTPKVLKREAKASPKKPSSPMDIKRVPMKRKAAKSPVKKVPDESASPEQTTSSRRKKQRASHPAVSSPRAAASPGGKQRKITGGARSKK